jgi:hypothetical protein
MILPAYLLWLKAPIPDIYYEWAVALGFVLFVVSIVMSLFGKKISYL